MTVQASIGRSVFCYCCFRGGGLNVSELSLMFEMTQLAF